MTCAGLIYFSFKYWVWCKFKVLWHLLSAQQWLRRSLWYSIIWQIHTHILEEPATFLFQVTDISSARLHSITSQKKTSYQRKNPNRSSYKIRFIYDSKCATQWQITLETKYVQQIFLIDTLN
jgi:hypothetical protein